MDILYDWKTSRLSDAIKKADQLLTRNPDCRIVMQMLSLRHPKLTGKEWTAFAELVRKSRDLHYLDISGMGISSLKEIAEVPLNGLNCSNNQLTSLNGIEKMPLKSLDFSGNRIKKLTADQASFLARIPHVERKNNPLAQ